MNNYKLIHSEQALQEFISFLPDLLPNEGYFLILIARNKWAPENDIPSAVKLRRETVSKENIIRTIRQWEVAEGSYKTKTGVEIANDNLGVYIGFNPKNQHAACFSLIQECLDNIKTGRTGINVKSMANDVIQKSNGSKNFIDIDVDLDANETEEQVMEFIREIIYPQHLTFIRTSGGFHCLVNLKDHLPMGWYQQISNCRFKSDLNIMSNDLLPVVGCNQGKYVPNLIY